MLRNNRSRIIIFRIMSTYGRRYGYGSLQGGPGAGGGGGLTARDLALRKNAWNVTTDQVDASTRSNIKVTIPILDVAANATQAEWEALETVYATDPSGKQHVYKPSKVYDNINNSSGFGTSAAHRHAYPVNNYVINLTPRTMNPLLAPLKIATLSQTNYTIGSTITVEYIPFDVNRNSGNLLVSFWKDGQPVIMSTDRNATSNDTILGLSSGLSCTFTYQSKTLTNRDVMQTQGEGNSSELKGWNDAYDGPSIKCFYWPNTTTEISSNKAIGQIVITFSVTAYNFAHSKASNNITDWCAADYEVGKEPEAGKDVTGRLGVQQAGEHRDTKATNALYVRAAEPGMKLNTWAHDDSFRVVKLHTKRMGEYAAFNKFRREYLGSVYGDEFATLATPSNGSTVIAGCDDSADALCYQSAASYNENLRSFCTFEKGKPVNIVDGMYFLVRDYSGEEYMLTDQSVQWIDELDEPNESCSILDSVTCTNMKGPSFFRLADECSIKGTDGTAVFTCCKPENITSVYLPISDKFITEANPVVLSSDTGITVNQNILFAVPFRDVNDDLLTSSKVHGTTFDMELDNEDPIEMTSIPTSTNLESNIFKLAINSTPVHVPKEINEMKDLKLKYVEGKRKGMAASRQGIGTLIATVKAGIQATTNFIGAMINKTDGSNKSYCVHRGNMLGGIRNPNMLDAGEACILNSAKGDGDAYIIIPDDGERSQVHISESGAHPSWTIGNGFKEFQNASKYYIVNPTSPEKAYFVKVNNTYEICPGITLGISSPISWANRDTSSNELSARAYTPRTNDLAKSCIVPNVQSEVWPVLIASRYPASDPACMGNCVFLTLPTDQYQTVKFNTDSTTGEYKVTTMDLEHKSGGTPYARGSVSMTWVPLDYSNNVTINTGFYIPDKLPDKNTKRLEELKAGEKMYVYMVLKLQHNLVIKNAWARGGACNNSIAEAIYNKMPYLRDLAGDSESTDKSASSYGCIFSVATKFDRLLLSDGTAADPETEGYTPAKGVNQLVNTTTSVQVSVTGSI